MEEVIVATDVVLRAIIGHSRSIEKLIAEARRGEIRLVVPHESLYFAVYSIRSTDVINTSQFAELIQYCQILRDGPEFLGAEERDSWRPNSQEVENWRRLALEEN